MYENIYENDKGDVWMKPISRDEVEKALSNFVNKDIYIHLETTQGAYAAHHGGLPMVVGAYIRNTIIRFVRGSIAGTGPYRVGLKMDHGWVYAEGLTDWEVNEQGQLLLAGHDPDGKLAVALQLSEKPF